MQSKIVKVGIIGCGEVAQVIHIPTLNFMHEMFEITFICGKSPTALEFCSRRVNNHIPTVTNDPEVLCASPNVDVVFVLSSDEYHPSHIVLALKYNKYVFVEKPMAMTEADAYCIIGAEKVSKGKVFVGYMRRYAPAFVDAVNEIGGLDNILYARVRDIIGPNSLCVAQSGMFPQKCTDYSEDDIRDRSTLAEQIACQGLRKECKIEPTPVLTKQYRLLGALGSHDLSAMREALGMPTGVLGASLGPPFWSALFKYPSFTVSYESGFYDVPLYDAHIEVYSKCKSVRIQYDTPYIKGLPITMHIRENVNGALKETAIRRTYEDPFTLQMRELYAVIVEGRPIKTTPQDALQDLYLYRMIMQQGTLKDRVG